MEAARVIGALAKAILLFFGLSVLSEVALAQITPRLVADINALGGGAPVDSGPRDFVDQGTWSYFVALSPTSLESWGTDGTTGGTNRLGALVPVPGNFTGATFVRMGTESFFVTGDTNGSTVWGLDGTPEGTRIVANFPSGARIAGALGNQLILLAAPSTGGSELWRSNGTAAGTQPIRDGNGVVAGILPSHIFADGKFYFMTSRPSILEAWVSDGTDAGTQRLATFEPDPSTGFKFMRAGRSVLLLAERPGTDGLALWRIDIDTGIVSMLIADPGFSAIEAPRELGNVTLFRATMQSNNSGQLWRSDGTVQGTFRVPGTAPFQNPEEAFFGPLSSGRLVYVANEGNGNPSRLWATDGTTASPITTEPAGGLEQIGALVYFRAGFGLWRSDGTQAGTRKLTGVPDANANFMLAGDGTRLFVRRNQGPLGQGTTEIYRYDLGTDTAATLRTSTLTDDALVFSVARGLLYFDSYDAVTGNELWISDGTVGGTRLLRNLAPETNSRSSSPSNFAQLGGRLYFVADEGITGRELWRTDGSPFHTAQVVDANPGPGSSDPQDLFAANGQLFFFAKDATGDYKFWRSDGTPGGTRALATISPVSQMPNRPLRACGSLGVGAGANVYFPAFDDVRGIELWRTDGTASGTAPYDINGGAADSSPCWLAEQGGNLYFTADGGPAQGDIEVWKVDGASMQPSRVTNVSPAPTPGEPDVLPANLTSFNGAVYFGWIDGSRNAQLLRLNPATGALSVVVQFPAAQSAAVSDIHVLNSSTLLFVRRPQAEIWRSDTTPAGTVRVGNVNLAGELLVHGGRAYFSGIDLGSGASAVGETEPWVSDGTDAGTRLLRNIDSGIPRTSPEFFMPFSGVTLFQVRDQIGTNPLELWQTNGTDVGTFKLLDLGPATSLVQRPLTRLSAGQIFYFAADDGASGLELFAIDDGPPLATSDQLTVPAGGSREVGVLDNDFDVGGTIDTASLRIEAAPRGTVAVSSSGRITYTAPAGFTGLDTFTYSVADDDGHRTAPVNVFVSVNSVGPPPPPPPPGSGSSGGGGGSLGSNVLAILLLLVAFRRDRSSKTVRPMNSHWRFSLRAPSGHSS